VTTLPVEKAVTDTDAAAAEGLRRGYRSFAFYGVLGGRPDHTLANYALLARLSQQGCEARAYGAGFEITAVTDGALELPARQNGAAAVFSWTDESAGVTIRGLKYGLENGTLRSNFALGVSNSFTGAPAFAEVKRGTLLIFAETA
jgi:thiamine pyrophosphokinase